MKKKGLKFLSLLFICAFSRPLSGQTLIMNEVSNGPAGNQEYVEFVVVDTTAVYNCAGTTPPCIDIRGWIFDDNSGYHGTSGVAAGAVRFSNNALWACVPLGTIILIYNNADRNTSIPPDDLSMADGNCTIIAPINNASLFESNATTPGAVACSYPAAGWTAGGNWNNTLLANAGDCARIVNLAGCEVFSVCWATDNLNNLIYFNSGNSGTDNVWFFNGIDPTQVANWTDGCADPTTCGSNQQTPGAPNNAANAAYIAQFNNGCTPITPLVVSATSVNAGCGCTGSATVSATGSIAGYTYFWTPSPGAGQGTNHATNMCAGTYSCIVSSSIGCSDTVVVTIASGGSMTASVSCTNVNCFGGATASATASASGGSGALTYLWSPAPGAGQGTSSVAGLSAQTYTLTVTDAIGCSVQALFTPTQPAAITASVVNTPVNCNGGNNGTASVTASGGTSPYTYSWSPSGGTGTIASLLVAGNYTVTVTDAHSCTVTATTTITQPTALSASTTNTPVSCNGGNNGTATVTAAGGTSPYTYSWSPSGGTGATASSLVAGNYTVTVTDANTCTITATATIAQPTVLNASTANTPVGCNGGNNGTATVTASGGTSPYIYSWSPSGGTGTTASSLVAGNYTVTVTDAHSCTVTATTTITQPTALSASTTNTPVSCNGGNNGTATITASGGTSPYTYSWSPSGGTGITALTLVAGNYTVAVTDANSCTFTATTTIIQPTALGANTTNTPVSCNGGSNGTATVFASGGTSPYTYSWSPTGGAGTTASSLVSGNYTVTVADVHSCTVAATTTITQPTALSASTTNTPVSCNGGNNGTATVTASGGTIPYTYSWSPSGGSGITASTLVAGNYTVTVTDANTCTVNASATIVEPSPLNGVSSSVAATCGNSNGSASVVANGGTPAYSYVWTPSGGSGATTTGVSSGTFTCTITDANACTYTVSATVNNSGSSTLSINAVTNVSCFGGSNGTATVNASGGAGGYSYLWSPSGGSLSVASNLVAGNYTVTVTDAASCVSTATVTITQPSVLTATVSSTPVSCNAGTNGTANVNVSGGSSGYAFSWSPSGGTSSLASNLPAGNFSVSVTDANNCTVTASVSVTEPSALAIVATGISVSCNGQCNGQASVVASGGTSPYQYLWSNGSGSSTINSLCAGTYSVIVTDANACLVDSTLTISEPAAFSLSISSQSTHCNHSDGAASVSVAGGTPAYVYSWAGNVSNNDTILNIVAGNYSVSITDASGCMTDTIVNVTDISGVSLSMIQHTNVTCFGGSDGALQVSSSGGTGPYNYLWSNGQTLASVSNLGGGTYCVAVTDANGCSDSICAIITHPGPLSISSSGDTICNGQSVTLSANASGGNGGPYSYNWNNGQYSTQNITVNPTASASYSVVATDPAGCSSSTSVSLVNVFPPLSINATGDTACPGQSATIFATANGGNGNYSFTLQPGNVQNTTGVFSSVINSTQQYTVTVSDGCTVLPAVTNATAGLFSIPVLTPVSPVYSACPQFCGSVYDSLLSSLTQISAWQWSLNNGMQSSGSVAQFCLNQSGSYNLSCSVVTVDGCTVSVVFNNYFTVFPQPNAAFTFVTEPLSTLDPAMQTINSSTAADSYLWNFGDSAISTLTNPVHLFEAEGTYTVELIATNQYGCVDSVEHSITVNPDFTFYAPNTFTPDGNSYNNIFLPLGVGWDNTSFQMWIYDRWGNMIFSTERVNEGWDGKANGGTEVAQMDVYVWKVNLKDIFGKTHKYIGHVSLVK